MLKQIATGSSSRPLLGLLENGLHHFVAKLGGFGELRRKVLGNPLEAIPVGLKVTK